ncbi:hypothetical protein YH65_07680 [Sulfurovum lithotrophicum]|uniref:Uncharacterized protein n=1 Tax=Sulfurovum lithotrophicum TaxID=206403 RepID=A0A7U4RR07_9BACT|nr:hypothetical protein YH65_07680 [Sulfurovum lithotrophicum]
MKLNNLSLQTRLSFFILSTLLLAMGIMLYISLFFYKNHFKEEIYEDFDSISKTIIVNKLYTFNSQDQIKEKLLENAKWCLPSYKHVLENTNIQIGKQSKDFPDDIISYSSIYIIV